MIQLTYATPQRVWLRKDALVMSYRRNGSQGPVEVENIQLFIPGQQWSVVLSYRVSNAALFRPVIEKARRSIQVPLLAISIPP